MSSVPLPGARAGRDPARAIKRGPRRLPAEVVAATQRDRLYDGLVHTVAQKGFVNARVSDICQAAGVTRPAFYALFAGKEDAFLATYQHGTSVLLGLMDQAYASVLGWRAGVRESLRTLLDVLAAVPAFAVMAIVEIDAAGPVARAARDQLLDDFGRFFVDAPPLPGARLGDELIGSIVGGIYSTIRRHVAAGRTNDLPDLLPSISYFLMVPFLGREVAETELHAASEPQRTTPPCSPLDPLSTER
jgi:AcrR family transcriptional regulator